MLGKILGKYGSRSGVIRQLSALVKENDQIRRLVQFNKSLGKNAEIKDDEAAELLEV